MESDATASLNVECASEIEARRERPRQKAGTCHQNSKKAGVFYGIHSPTDHHRKTAVSHQVAAKLPRPAVVKAQATAAPKRVEKRTLMGKIALIERVAQRSGKSVKETSAVVNATLETIREALTRGDAVQLRALGPSGCVPVRPIPG